MTIYPVNIENRQYLKFLSNLSPDVRFLLLIMTALSLWFSLACVMWNLYPDATLSIKGNMTTFLKFGSRNSIGFLMVFGSISLLLFLLKSKSEPLLSFAIRTIFNNHKYITKSVLHLSVGIITFCIFLCAFSMIKTRIPEMIPYKWDMFFAQLDRLLFFGKDPWTYFDWIYDRPGDLRTLDKIYNIWAALFAGSWVCAFIGKSDTAERRYRYIIALMLTWFIGGNVIATLLSSAGPCYYGLIVTGQPDIFAEQMRILRSHADLSFVTYQDWLWSVYQSPSQGVGGISAMPSMHCSTAFLFILMYGRTPIMRVITWAFFLTIFCSSFILAWHYAVDGLLGIIIAYFCWKLAGKISDFISFDRPAFNAQATTHH